MTEIWESYIQIVKLSNNDTAKWYRFLLQDSVQHKNETTVQKFLNEVISKSFHKNLNTLIYKFTIEGFVAMYIYITTLTKTPQHVTPVYTMNNVHMSICMLYSYNAVISIRNNSTLQDF